MILKLSLFLVLFVFFTQNIFSQIGIGTTNPHESAIVEIQSTTKGFLPPRLTINERNLISIPAPGLLIYNKSIACIETYNGLYWFNHCCSKIVNSGLSNVSEHTVLELEFDDVNNIKDHLNANIVANGFIETINSVEGNNYNISEIHNNEAANGTPQDTLFKFIVSNQEKPPYTASHFIKRTRNSTVNGYGNNNYLTVDVPDIENSDFEIFAVARFSNSGQQGNYASIFHTRKWNPTVPTDGIGESFQISAGHSAIGTADKYNLRHDGVNGNTNITIDDKFHVFNIIYSSSNTTVTLYMDGEEVYSANETLTVKEVSFFTNRHASSSPQSEIGSFVLYDSILSDNSRETVNKFLLCKYGDL